MMRTIEERSQMTARPLRFGIWALVHGPRAAHQDPEEPYDASWERNRDLVLAAEALGYDSTLIAQHTINPHREDLDQLEAWSSAAALAALTSRIEIIAAIKPYLYHPVVLAKMALQIENISRGRFAINLVNAWNRPELDKAGIGFPEHDARYAYGREWITVVSRLMQGERLTYKGEHFDVRDYALRPADLYRPRPLIYVGGESAPARDLVADHGDVPHDRGWVRRSDLACQPSWSRVKPVSRPMPLTNGCCSWRQRMRRCGRSRSRTQIRRS
jgi:alkanesulfonate monooxygenase